MAKTYIDIVKYLIYAEIEVDGLVDKPDVVGAVFGQTEGLLGDELDLRELQKNGRIGRIEVDLNAKGGKTYGLVKIPSSLDMVETSIIGASLETVDRVGPCEGKIKVQKIEDTRNQKRKVLVDRAKNLLKNMLITEIPDSKEISELVREEVKTAEVTEYGAEKLTSGPGINKLNEITVVEGRADVINLLKNDIQNVIAIGGARVPKIIVELSREKEVTVFLDGDRGGDIILNELVQGGVEIDFVARAPMGKEVEELTRKEIIKALRAKVPFEQIEEQKIAKPALQYLRPQIAKKYSPEPLRTRSEQTEHIKAKALETVAFPSPFLKTEPSNEAKKVMVPSVKPMFEYIEQSTELSEPTSVETINEKSSAKAELLEQIESKETMKKNNEQYFNELDDLNNSLKARLYENDNKLVKEVAVRDVIKSIEESENIETVIFDGIITQRLVDISAKKNIRRIVGVKLGNVGKKPDNLEIITKNK